MVGSLWGTDSYFHRDGYGGTESHFGVGYDGEILQWQDTTWRADANLDGGDRVISVETADLGTSFPAWSGSNVPAWTPAQIEANAQIAAWVYRTHGIPLRLIPNTAQSSEGQGYHRQGIDPWRCSTCERWSNSYGKVCPGDRRIAQMPLVVARANQIIAGEDTSFMGYIDDRTELFAEFDAYFISRTDPKNGSQLPTAEGGPHPVARNLRVLPWHQMLGRANPDGSYTNMHGVMAHLDVLALDFRKPTDTDPEGGPLYQLLKQAADAAGCSDEQIDRIIAEVTAGVSRVDVVVDVNDNTTP